MILVQKREKKEAEGEALRLIEQVGLLDKKNEYPSRLSGASSSVSGLPGHLP